MQTNKFESKQQTHKIKERNSYVSSAIMKSSNNSSVVNLKTEVKSQKPINQASHKNYSYSPLIKKLINKGK